MPPPEHLIPAFEPRRFRTTVDHYVRGRLAYPAELIARVSAVAGLDRRHRVLDLGCGPGFLAAAFAPRVAEAVGVDPEPEMLRAAAAYAQRQSVHVTLRQGSSYDIGPDWGDFHLVAMGRSFHWMDRAATLESLARIVAADGAVALFGDSHLEIPENRWRQRFREVLEPFAEKDPGHAVTGRRGPFWIPHESFLLRSPFNDLQRFSVIRRLRTPVERLLDRALSMSTTSPERLGPERDGVLARLRAVLEEEARDGVVVEIVESEALVGFRRPASNT